MSEKIIIEIRIGSEDEGAREDEEEDWARWQEAYPNRSGAWLREQMRTWR